MALQGLYDGTEIRILFLGFSNCFLDLRVYGSQRYSVCLEIWTARDGIGYYVLGSRNVLDLKIVFLQKFRPPSLPAREIGLGHEMSQGSMVCLYLEVSA